MSRSVSVPFRTTGQFSKLFLDYCERKASTESFYKYFPDQQGYQDILRDFSFPIEQRELLARVISQQYAEAKITPPVDPTILKSEDTFTVCTGHQLCLLTGPLYFIYKILTTVRLAEELQKLFPDKKFIPIFWMASEDHDFEEIDHCYVFGNKIAWEAKGSGAVGRFNLKGISRVISEIESLLKGKEYGEELTKILMQSYREGGKLSDATRALVHGLFMKQGLLILDPDDKELKTSFKSIMEEELFFNRTEKLVVSTNKVLAEKNYKVRVNARDVNLFLLGADSRKRIDKETVKGREEEWKKRLLDSPESFSPNVLMRPLYQQKVLPNIAYVGGPAEVDYWLQLGSLFEHFKINYPVIHPRSFFALLDVPSMKKMLSLQLEAEDLFSDQDSMVKMYLQKISGDKISFNRELEEIGKLFEEMERKAGAIDESLVGAVQAERKKQTKSIENLEKKLLRSFKHKNEGAVNHANRLHERLFPGNRLQERHDNFINWYAAEGAGFFQRIKQHLNPFDLKFNILLPD